MAKQNEEPNGFSLENILQSIKLVKSQDITPTVKIIIIMLKIQELKNMQ